MTLADHSVPGKDLTSTSNVDIRADLEFRKVMSGLDWAVFSISSLLFIPILLTLKTVFH